MKVHIIMNKIIRFNFIGTSIEQHKRPCKKNRHK